MSSTVLDLAIIGAGPYGLSLAAHLQRKLSFRIFGFPMQPWEANMPPGMLLKSDVFSSSLSAPGPGLSVREFSREIGRPLGDATPIPLEMFVAYGRAFQERLVPHVERSLAMRLSRVGDTFELLLDTGERVRARRAIVAVGVRPFAHTPSPLADLPAALCSHSAQYGPVEVLAGRDVVVIGGGASAADLAAALHDGGARARIIARRRTLDFHSPPAPRSLWAKLRAPGCGIGMGWTVKFCADVPQLFQLLPGAVKARIVERYLGPAPGWFMRERIVGRIPVLGGMVPEAAEQAGGKVRLRLRTAAGDLATAEADHVVAATGYRTDLGRLGFLDRELAAQVRTQRAAPILSRAFETSARGLYFIGPAAAMSFGPVMRFVYGADFTARTLAAHLVGARGRRFVSLRSTAPSADPAPASARS